MNVEYYFYYVCMSGGGYYYCGLRIADLQICSKEGFVSILVQRQAIQWYSWFAGQILSMIMIITIIMNIMIGLNGFKR